jgi:hypothetical protein
VPILIAVLLALLAAPLATAADEPIAAPVDELGSILLAFGDHLRSHPLAGAEDLYKLLHQSVFGPGHAIPSREAAQAYLERELAGLAAPLADEPRCEALGGEPPLVRVNLRPFAAAGGDSEALLDELVAEANQPRGNAELMARVLDLAVRYLGCAGRGELAPELERLGAELAPKGYPAIHHSELYREAYRPAYRVVGAERAAARGWCREDAER